MTDSDEILVLTPDEFEPDVDAFDDSFEVKRRPLWPFVLVGGALLGFAAAFSVSWFIQPEPYDPAPLRAELDSLKQEIAQLQNRPAPVIPKVDLTPLNRRLVALEARPTVEPLSEEIVARMETLQANDFKLPEIPEGLQNVSALDDRISDLEAQLKDQAIRISALTEAAGSQRDNSSELYIDPSNLPRFPADILRDGAAQLSGSGLIKRTFSRHVQVRGSEDPERLIDAVERHLAEGHPEAALQVFDKLPSRLRTLARGWRADMEDAVQ